MKNRPSNSVVCAACCFLLTGASALAQSGSGRSGKDAQFAKEAAIGGMVEVELGKLASSKASSDKVKQFGQKMVDDHSKANNELKAVADKNQMTLPTELDAKHKAVVNKLSGLSGGQFDKAYVAMMVKDHDKDVADFQQEANSGTNSDLKSFASKTLPTLQEHDRMIKDISANVNSTSGGSTARQE